MSIYGSNEAREIACLPQGFGFLPLLEHREGLLDRVLGGHGRVLTRTDLEGGGGVNSALHAVGVGVDDEPSRESLRQDSSRHRSEGIRGDPRDRVGAGIRGTATWTACARRRRAVGCRVLAEHVLLSAVPQDLRKVLVEDEPSTLPRSLHDLLLHRRWQRQALTNTQTKSTKKCGIKSEAI